MRGTESEEGVQGGGRGFRVLLCAAGPISLSHLHLRAAGQTQGLGLLRRQPALQCSPHCGGERDASSPSSATLLAHDPQQEEFLQHCMKQDIYPVETTSLRILHLYTKQSVTHIFGFGNYTDYQNNLNSSLNQTAYYKPKPNPKTTPKHFTQ